MEKLNSLPGVAILTLDGSRDHLDRAIERDDVPDDIKKTLTNIRDGIGVVIQHAEEAQRERDPEFAAVSTPAPS
jgi:hypothetical protein